MDAGATSLLLHTHLGLDGFRGSTPFYLTALGAVVPAHVAPVVLLCLAGLLVAGAAVAGPETRDVELGSGDPDGNAADAAHTA